MLVPPAVVAAFVLGLTVVTVLFDPVVEESLFNTSEDFFVKEEVVFEVVVGQLQHFLI